MASLSGISAALLVLVAAMASTSYVKTRAAMEGESQQRRRAEATTRLAEDVLDKIFEREAQTTLVGRFSTVSSYRVFLATVQGIHAELLAEMDHLAAARSLFDDAIAGLSDLLKEEPSRWDARGVLERSYAGLAAVLEEMDEDALAREAALAAEALRYSRPRFGRGMWPR